MKTRLEKLTLDVLWLLPIKVPWEYMRHPRLVGIVLGSIQLWLLGKALVCKSELNIKSSPKDTPLLHRPEV